MPIGKVQRNGPLAPLGRATARTCWSHRSCQSNHEAQIRPDVADAFGRGALAGRSDVFHGSRHYERFYRVCSEFLNLSGQPCAGTRQQFRIRAPSRLGRQLYACGDRFFDSAAGPRVIQTCMTWNAR